MAAIADALLRHDVDNPLADAFAGRTVGIGALNTESAGTIYGTSAALFAKQMATTLIVSPELATTKTRVIDYFDSLGVSLSQ
jgi:hypothetical protein